MNPYRQNASPRKPSASRWGRFVAFLACPIAALIIGCSVLFPGLQTGTTVADLDAFITVASNVSAWAADAWSLVPPDAQASATAAYDDVQNGLKTAIQLAQDAVAGISAGENDGGAPNLTAIIAAVDNAVDAVVTEIASLASSTTEALPGSSKVTLMSGVFATRLAQLQAAQKTAHRFHAP